MHITNQEITIAKVPLENLRKHLPRNAIRFIIAESDEEEYVCEVDILKEDNTPWIESVDIFAYQPRTPNTKEFNIAFCVPTGIGAEIGGHCGDATIVAKLFGSICDNLITHPNCVNAANYNEQPINTLYTEGSTFTRLFMGTIGLKPARSNKILLLVDKHSNRYYNDEIINAASTARMQLGLQCDVHIITNPISSKVNFSQSGRASGLVENIDLLFDEIDKFVDNYDAIALSTQLQMPLNYYHDYFVSNSMRVNPWGSVEAMISHAVSLRYNLPCAHAPLISEEAFSMAFCGVVEPRKAAESESIADIFCCLKGLHKAPRIVKPDEGLNSSDISCLVIPAGCLGLPVLAALDQGIPVISVKENKNLMRNKGLFEVENYWEALAVCQAIKLGIDPMILRRPIANTKVI